MNWDDVKVFLAVADAGGLTKAASLLRISPPTISRRIAEFERAVGMPLFTRHQSGYELTDEGQALRRRAAAARTAMLTVERAALDGVQHKGSIRFVTAESIANSIVLPKLHEFERAHPGVGLEIVTGKVTASLNRREADVTLTLMRPTESDILIRKVGQARFGLYGSLSYLETLPTNPDQQLESARILGWSDRFSHLETSQMLATIAGHAQGQLLLHSMRGQLIAAKEGLGLAMLPCILGDAEPTLTRVNQSEDSLEDIWLATHRDLKQSQKVSAFIDFLLRVMRDADSALMGSP